MVRFALTAVVFLIGFRALSQQTSLRFVTSDTAIQNAFDWAQQMALSYRGNANDPVGPWYEAALPSRNAFCIRDVSHQCLGAEILGMSGENKNMMEKFLRNISASKDWCTFWEISKWNAPAAEDYKNDSAFWYNLDANFELIYGCERLFRWTGDTGYIYSAVNNFFFEKTLNDFIHRWKLQPDSLFTRPSIANKPRNYDKDDNYTRSRGLPSYVESVDGMRIGADLVAAIYRGFVSYSSILKMRGELIKSEKYQKMATPYLQQLNSTWWDRTNGKYHTFFTTQRKFGAGEGTVSLLWFDAIGNNTQKRAVIQQVLKGTSNVEGMSYLPYLLYKNGYDSLGKYYLLHICDPATRRREYPEVSFGAIEGIVQGLMGIEADYSSSTITSCYKGNEYDDASIDNLPVFQSLISIKHKGKKESVFTNNGNKVIKWRPYFAGKHKILYVNGKPFKAQTTYDTYGNAFAFVIVEANCKRTIVVEAK